MRLSLLLLLVPAVALAAPAEVESRSGGAEAAPSFSSNEPPVVYDLIQQVTALQEEIQALRGELEEQRHRLDIITSSPAGKPAAAPTSSDFSTDSIQITLEPVVMETEQGLYDSAYQKMQSHKHEAAIADFETLLQKYPSGRFAANAHYWLGEIYLVKQDPTRAKVAFKTVVTNFSKHQKVADSLLKLGYIASNEDLDESIKLLSDVKARFPGTSSARLAEAKLQKINQERQTPAVS